MKISKEKIGIKETKIQTYPIEGEALTKYCVFIIDEYQNKRVVWRCSNYENAKKLVDIILRFQRLLNQ